jgi:hypothetical protein
MKRQTVIFVAGCVLPLASAIAGDMNAECPVGLPSNAVRPGAPVPGWVTTPQQMHLDSAGMMSGAPETLDYVTPEGTRDRSIYKFDKGDGQRWLWCYYGGIQLSRRLDDSITQCVLTFKKQRRDGVPTLTAVAECK